MDHQLSGGMVLFNVQEYMSGGSIDSRLWHTPYVSVSEEERVRWAVDTAEAMCFIHRQGYTHRDLKSSNILYDRQNGRAKVAGESVCADPRVTFLVRLWDDTSTLSEYV